MPRWKCTSCSYTVEAEVAPDECPSCKKKCEFVDVTCYIPECGGESSGNVNPQVFMASKEKK